MVLYLCLGVGSRDQGVRLSLLWLLVIIPMLGQGHAGRGFPHEPAGFPLAAWAAAVLGFGFWVGLTAWVMGAGSSRE